MRNTLIALAAAAGLIGVGAADAPAAPVAVRAQEANVQQAGWYCGPRCEHWRHRPGEEPHARWHERHGPYYGYGHNAYYHYH